MGCKILKVVTWPWPRPFEGRFVIDKPTHQIWSACLHPLQIYERRRKMSKMGWFGVTQGHWK